MTPSLQNGEAPTDGNVYPRASSIIMLGTGTSGGVPSVACLTNPAGECKVCPSAMTKEGEKNFRRNTSAAVLIEVAPGDTRTILIDCGKSFNYGAITLFPRFGLRRVDALLLTHDHADACFGLDDLRSLTLQGTFAPVQDHVPIYTSPETHAAISNMFPYMVDSSKATGGGDIPSFVWHQFEPSETFTIHTCGDIRVMPLPVEHGMYFASKPPKPYMCMGFRIGDVSYVSDANRIPEETKRKIEGSKVLILDALRERPHASHFSFDEAKEFVMSLSIKPEVTYWVGFAHQTDHYTLEEQLRIWSEQSRVRIEPAYDGLQILL